MKAQTAPSVGGYIRAIVTIRIAGKWTTLDWLAMDTDAPYSRR